MKIMGLKIWVWMWQKTWGEWRKAKEMGIKKKGKNEREQKNIQLISGKVESGTKVCVSQSSRPSPAIFLRIF